MSLRKVIVFGIVVATLVLGFGVANALGQKPFEGVTITVFTQPPPFVAKSVQMFAPSWEKLTGAHVKLITAPWAELHSKMYTALATGSHSFDIILFPSAWLADFASAGYLAPLNKLIANDPRLDWDDILPVYRERIATWGGKIYAIPLDGDNHIFYYRKDALENPKYQAKFKEKYGYDLPVPPRTWEQVRDIAEFFNGWDWDHDGHVEYGVVEARRKGDQAYWTFFSRAAGYCSVPGQPGGLFFDPETMKPLINDPGHLQALKDYIGIMKYGVPGMINMDSGEIRTVFCAGEAAMAIDWGDIGIMADTSPGSAIKGKVGYAILPGSTKVWNYKTGKWMSYKEPNQAPYLAFGGWMGAIDAKSPNVKAAYSFLSYLGEPKNSYISVTTPETGFNPYRESHFKNLDGWYKYGMVDPKDYLQAIHDTINSPNVQPDLRIPGAARYFEALDAQLALAVAGQKTPQQALDATAAAWDQITNDLGRESQLKAYRLSLGLPVKG